jgi:sugar phosphate isomerase/epimerase
MSIRNRLGFDAGGMGLEEALAWAARHSFHSVDFNADQPPNTLDAWDEARQAAALARLQRAVAYDEQVGPRLLLENLNVEPADAEVRYMGHTVEECRYYFDAMASAHFGWAFTVNHAHLVPEGIAGFLDAFGVRHIGEVRLADSLGDKEAHLTPGAGNIDFAALFQRLESSGYPYHYMMAFGSLEDKLVGRDSLAACWHKA